MRHVAHSRAEAVDCAFLVNPELPADPVVPREQNGDIRPEFQWCAPAKCRVVWAYGGQLWGMWQESTRALTCCGQVRTCAWVSCEDLLTFHRVDFG